MTKLKPNSKVRCTTKKNKYFTKDKIYEVRDSDLDIGRVWALDDNNFTELLDKNEWELVKEFPSTIKNWGDW
jgi:hypothetical protein